MTSPIGWLVKYLLHRHFAPFGQVPPRHGSTHLTDDRVLAVDWSTNRGAPGTEKTRNEDAARWGFLATKAGPVLLLALADGVTSSSCGFWASRVACAAGLRAMEEPARRAYDEDGPGVSTHRLSTVIEAGFTGADTALAGILNRLRSEPERYWSRQEEPHLATWRYVLARGQVMETTLCLAMIDPVGIIVGSVGDSLVALRRCRSGETCDVVIGAPDEGEHGTAALRGDDTYRIPPESFTRALYATQDYEGTAALVLATDGVARHADASSLLDALCDRRPRPDGWARQSIHDLKGRGAGEDNMTMIGVTVRRAALEETGCEAQQALR